jgi:ribosomal protein S18 acetylase RimI-like enzyme
MMLVLRRRARATRGFFGMDKAITVIRRLGTGDVESFRRVRLEALHAEPAAYASKAADWESLSDDEWRRRLTDNPVFAAFHGEEPIGIMGLFQQRSSKMTHRATIIMVYVRQTLRRSGVATALLKSLTDCARDRGIRQLELAVSVENPAAIRFYRSEGFTETGRIPGGFMHEGRQIDELTMVRRIGD